MHLQELLLSNRVQPCIISHFFGDNHSTIPVGPLNPSPTYTCISQQWLEAYKLGSGPTIL